MVEIHWTAPHLEEAKKLTALFFDAKLIACAHFIDPIHSLFLWEGALQETKETWVILKTVKEHLEKIIALIQTYGSYSVPEIKVFSPDQVHPPYLEWIKECTQA